MKRRTFLAASGAAGLLVASGFAYNSWRKYQPIELSDTYLDSAVSEHYDICIVGSGPAGCTLAEQSIASGHKVLLIESGISLSDPRAMGHAEQIDRYTVSGIGYPVSSTRIRALGGTSNVWGGRCPRLQPNDFTENPYGDWPISYWDLQPYYKAAENSLNVRGEISQGYHAPRNHPLKLQMNKSIDFLRK